MTEYREDRRWSDQYIPLIKQIVGPYLLLESSLEVDCTEATDLIVLGAKHQQIGCRVRRPGYWPKYAGQFTIRSTRTSGVTTELQKVVEGFCDLMFYGFSSEPEPSFAEWYLIHLKHWRAHMIRNRGQIKMGETPNHDNTTSFTWFDIASFPEHPPLLLAKWPTDKQTNGAPVAGGLSGWCNDCGRPSDDCAQPLAHACKWGQQ